MYQGNGYVIADAMRFVRKAGREPSEPATQIVKAVYYYHNDHLGTPQALNNQDQVIV